MKNRFKKVGWVLYQEEHHILDMEQFQSKEKALATSRWRFKDSTKDSPKPARLLLDLMPNGGSRKLKKVGWLLYNKEFDHFDLEYHETKRDATNALRLMSRAGYFEPAKLVIEVPE